MSIQISPAPGLARRDRRATSYCDIWDIVAPHVACPACSGAHDEQLRAAADGAGEPALPTAAVPEHLHLVDLADDVTDAAPTPEALPPGDVSAQASALLSLLAS